MHKRHLVMLVSSVLICVISLACGGSDSGSRQQGAVQTTTPLNQEEKLYATKLVEYLRSISQGIEWIDILLDSADANPALTRDEDWQITTASVLLQIRMGCQLVKELAPPARFRDVHRTMTEAADHFDGAVDLMAAGIDERNPVKMEAADEELRLGREALRLATVQIDNMMTGTASGVRLPVPTFTPTLVPSAIPSPVYTATSTPTTMPTAMPSIEPLVEYPKAVVNQEANLRSGPGTSYARVGGVAKGDILELFAINAAGDWYQLVGGAWIAAFLVDGAPTDLPVISD